MSTTVHNTNEACCTIPPVLSEYEAKGTIKPYAGFQKVYITGPSTSENAIVAIFDIFGFFPQTQQGADILASTLNTTVYMPDFFEPDSAFDISRFPPKTDEDKAAIQAFFGSTASPSVAITKLKAFGEALKSNGVKRVGVYGMCWGGKVAIASGGEATPFHAVSLLHPAMLSAEDAEKLTVPLAIYVSHDEPIAEYNKIVDIISKKSFADKNDAKNYDNMFHGWAAARSNLKNEENRKEFEDVYGRLSTFFRRTLV
ncbi:Alpha/Beta hydrolase protein [Armillaria nabsnona]|nr:Alpha/Beta hydrolase protein [Armillaria nabsnona]